MKFMLPIVLVALLAACGETAPTAKQCGVYAIGPNQIKEILASQQSEPAPGRTAKADLPADFPTALLDPENFYRGMGVYCSADEARQALIDQKHQDWGVFEIESDWNNNVYKADDGAYHLRESAKIKKAVE